MKKKILLWFDVEDYLTPESDDVFKSLLDMMEEFGLRATIKFCVRKLALLQERGRTDILNMLAHHEMAFHTTNHSIHPLPCEYLDSFGFSAGAAEFERREKDGLHLLQDLCGQNLTSYGQPGEAWSPQVFPALRKWGIYTYLDGHPILNVNGQPFWYGGVLCLTMLNNLSHLVKDGSTGEMVRMFDNMNTACEDTVFFSIYDHPAEFSGSVFWDEVNFLKGRNPYTYQPAPLRTPEERDGLLTQYREFFEHTVKMEDVEYLTALESLRCEHQRTLPVTASDLKAFVAGFDGGITYHKVKGAYLAPSELFGLMARHLTGKALLPELIYGPEERLESVIVEPTVSVKELAEAAWSQFDQALGFKQLRSLYKVGGNFLNPVDLFCTMAKAIASGADRVDIVRGGRLAAEDHVNEEYIFGGGWVLFADDFKGERIFEHTRLQCWTLKPAIF